MGHEIWDMRWCRYVCGTDKSYVMYDGIAKCNMACSMWHTRSGGVCKICVLFRDDW